MTRRWAAVTSGLAAVTALVVCMLVTPVPGHPAGWLLPPIVGLASLSVAWAASVSWRAYRHHRLTAQLRRIAQPATVRGILVRELAGSNAAFVAGLRRPHIFCSPELAGSLTPDELRAVLLHERYHQLDRAPAKLIMLDALAPLVGLFDVGRAWLARRVAAFEIAADDYALRHGSSRGSLARALLKLAPVQAGSPGIGFASAMDLRLRALIDGNGQDSTDGISTDGLPAWVVAPLAVAAFCLLLVVPW